MRATATLPAPMLPTHSDDCGIHLGHRSRAQWGRCTCAAAAALGVTFDPATDVATMTGLHPDGRPKALYVLNSLDGHRIASAYLPFVRSFTERTPRPITTVDTPAEQVVDNTGNPDGIAMWTRPDEVQLWIVTADAGLCNEPGCRKQLTAAMFSWNHRITDPMYRDGAWKVGEDRFTLSRHTDGTGPHSEHRTDCTSLSRCPKCRAYETLSTRDTGYGWTTTCDVEGCGYSNYADSGD